MCNSSQEVESMWQSIHVEPSLPRLCGRQRHRENVPALTPVEYYRHTVTIPILDHLISEIQTWFSEHNKTAHLRLNLIPSNLVTKPFKVVGAVLKPLEVLYTSNLRDDTSTCTVQTELHHWYLKWKALRKILMVQNQSHKAFCLLYLIALLIIPILKSCCSLFALYQLPPAHQIYLSALWNGSKLMPDPVWLMAVLPPWHCFMYIMISLYTSHKSLMNLLGDNLGV